MIDLAPENNVTESIGIKLPTQPGAIANVGLTRSINATGIGGTDNDVDASRSALAALSALVVKPEVPGGDTLEGLVRDMLKPMLTEWLDAKLPDVVERLVAAEIRRISERG